jgi:hypothetical protein
MIRTALVEGVTSTVPEAVRTRDLREPSTAICITSASTPFLSERSIYASPETLVTTMT